MTTQEFTDSLTKEQREFLLEWIATIQKGLDELGEQEQPPVEYTNDGRN